MNQKERQYYEVDEQERPKFGGKGPMPAIIEEEFESQETTPPPTPCPPRRRVSTVALHTRQQTNHDIIIKSILGLDAKLDTLTFMMRCLNK